MNLRAFVDGGTCPELNYNEIANGTRSVDLNQLIEMWNCRDNLRTYKYIINPWYRVRSVLRVHSLKYTLKRFTLYPWQRVVRGWDDSQIWNVDHSLACLAGSMVRELRKAAAGYVAIDSQGELCDDLSTIRETADCDDPTRWYALLDEIADGFEQACDAVISEYDHVKLQRSWDLLAKWHLSLWS